MSLNRQNKKSASLQQHAWSIPTRLGILNHCMRLSIPTRMGIPDEVHVTYFHVRGYSRCYARCISPHTWGSQMKCTWKSPHVWGSQMLCTWHIPTRMDIPDEVQAAYARTASGYGVLEVAGICVIHANTICAIRLLAGNHNVCRTASTRDNDHGQGCSLLRRTSRKGGGGGREGS